MTIKTSEINETLKAIRECKGLSQREFAALTGEHFQHISAIERGRQRPELKRLEKMCNAAGYQVRLIITERK